MKQKAASVLAAGLFAFLFSCASEKAPQRYGMVIGLKKEKLEYYKKLHANPWKGVLERIDKSHIRNFSIWLVEYKPDEYLLFGYFEYDGDDFEADMKAMSEDATTRRWWKETAPCQVPIPTAGPEDQWVMMEEVFYHDKDRPGAPLMPKPKTFKAGKSSQERRTK